MPCAMNYAMNNIAINFFKKQTLWSLFMDWVQLPLGYIHKETVYVLPLSSQKSLVPILPTSEDERLSQPCSHAVVLKTEPLGWETSPLTNRPLSHFLVIT